MRPDEEAVMTMREATFVGRCRGVTLPRTFNGYMVERWGRVKVPASWGMPACDPLVVARLDYAHHRAMGLPSWYMVICPDEQNEEARAWVDVVLAGVRVPPEPVGDRGSMVPYFPPPAVQDDLDAAEAAHRAKLWKEAREAERKQRRAQVRVARAGRFERSPLERGVQDGLSSRPATQEDTVIRWDRYAHRMEPLDVTLARLAGRAASAW